MAALRIVVILPLISGCGRIGFEQVPAIDNGGGGTQGSGGVASSGGAAASGGGTQGTGGAISTGAVAASGGGTQGTGGAVSTGAVAASGGDSGGTGGAVNTGGVVASGGTQGTGGVVSTGGTQGTGGAVSTGGMAATGGMQATGGVVSTGGVMATGGNGGTGGSLSQPGTACLTDGECTSNACVAGYCCDISGCIDDGDLCTIEACASGTGACQHLADNTNQDGDRYLDCEEDGDGIVSTSKTGFNGLTASLVSNGGGNCTEICLGSQISSLFSSPVETHDVYAGWEFNTDQPESQAPNSATFGFEPPFSSTFIGWRMLYRGLFWVPPSATGTYCFNVDIGSDGGSGTTDTSPDACGGIYLPDVQTNAWVMNGRHQDSTSDSPPMPSESRQRTKCTNFATDGPQRIDFVYQYSNNNPDNRHQMHVKYCYGNLSSCTPDILIDDTVLTPMGVTIP